MLDPLNLHKTLVTPKVYSRSCSKTRYILSYLSMRHDYLTVRCKFVRGVHVLDLNTKTKTRVYRKLKDVYTVYLSVPSLRTIRKFPTVGSH